MKHGDYVSTIFQQPDSPLSKSDVTKPANPPPPKKKPRKSLPAQLKNVAGDVQ